jgi:hypothetical protein
MQKLSLLVAASVIGFGSAYSAMAQAPASKPGAKAAIQAPALVTAKSNLGSFARVAPGAEARSAQISIGAMVKGASAHAVTSATGGRMSALAVSSAAASTGKTAKAAARSLVNGAAISVSAAKANLSGAVSTAGRTSAAGKARLNLTASGAPAAVTDTKVNFGSMARATLGIKSSGLTKSANLSALAQAAPAAAAMVNKSNLSAYAK